jgi:hypothetical protein
MPPNETALVEAIMPLFVDEAIAARIDWQTNELGDMEL